MTALNDNRLHADPNNQASPPAGTLAPAMAPTSAPNTPYPYGYTSEASRFRRS